MAQTYIAQFQEHPEAWTRVDGILSNSHSLQTKYIALQVLEKLIQTRWKILPREQCSGIRDFIVSAIIKISNDQASFDSQKVYLNKLNLVLVQILKHEWPKNWPNFIQEIVDSSRTSLTLCENNMVILKLLSEEVFDFSAEQMTSAKAKDLKNQMCGEFSKIFHLCDEVLQKAQKPSLIKVTLHTLLRFLNWIPLGYIFETNLIEMLRNRFLEVAQFRNITMKCLTEIGGLVVPPIYEQKLVVLYDAVIDGLSKIIPMNPNLAAYTDGSDEEEEFILNMAMFLTTFLGEHLKLVEVPEHQNPLLIGHMYLIKISKVDDREVFKVCLEYWTKLVSGLYNELPPSMENTLVLNATQPVRRLIYSDILSELRLVMVEAMVKPEEVLIVENDEGEIVREFIKETDTITLYKSMREVLVYLTHLDVSNTEKIMTEKLARQMDGSEWSWNNLNKLCWAIGSISGAMSEDAEKRFLVYVIKDLLSLTEMKRGKDNKAVVASNIMYIVGQYPRFLRAHWKFLKTVVNKLFEFMHETHEGVQDMACDTFIKIAQKCRRHFVLLQPGEAMPFVEEILATLPSIISALSPAQVHVFYEAVGCMISAQTNKAAQEKLIVDLMEGPNVAWYTMMAQAQQSSEVFYNPEQIKQLANIMKTNVAACTSIGSPFVTQIGRIYNDLLNVYRATSSMISTAVAEGGLIQTKTPRVRGLRTIKKEILKLIQTYILKAEDLQLVMEKMIPPLLDSVLVDYHQNVEPARDAEVLSLMTAIVQKLGPLMTQQIPVIFDSVFECTLNMINKDFQEYPEHRVAFFNLLKAINQICFPALLKMPPNTFKLVLDSIAWAFKHTMRDIADTGLQICLDLLNNVTSLEPGVANAFFQNYYLTLFQDTFYVLTDREHKSGFKFQAQILAQMCALVETNAISAPLFNPAQVPDPNMTNQQFLRDYLFQLLQGAFINLQPMQIKSFLQRLFASHADMNAFKQVLRDFLVQLKEFAGDDNSELFLEERETELEMKKKAEMEAAMRIPDKSFSQPTVMERAISARRREFASRKQFFMHCDNDSEKGDLSSQTAEDKRDLCVGLYDASYEKDACGVGFIAHIGGKRSHAILSHASGLLCNMTHRGAEGADPDDGDGAGCMTSLPHALINRFLSATFGSGTDGSVAEGSFATGNIFFHPDPKIRDPIKLKFQEFASSLGLNVIAWRPCPTDNSSIGKVARSMEPTIEQPIIVPRDKTISNKRFEFLLYTLRKQATHEFTRLSKSRFYICSLSTRLIIYKGQLAPIQVYKYFLDLVDSDYTTHFALVHSRFSTNTFPSWERAQPMRWCAHNGEINTLRGNKNWMRSREGIIKTPQDFPGSVESLFPIIESNGSDSATFDNVLELLHLTHSDLSLPEILMLMIPEAFSPCSESKQDNFYEYMATMMEPWDGPALMLFSDGRYVGAALDRNGLRPCRYVITDTDLMICASEVGAVALESAKGCGQVSSDAFNGNIIKKGRLEPGKILAIDTEKGQLILNDELKEKCVSRFPYGIWLSENIIRLSDLCKNLPEVVSQKSIVTEPLSTEPLLRGFGFNLEQLNMLLLPMVRDGKEALGSMGTDTPLACLSSQPRSIYDYFHQLFAQVTNPPIDPIREEIVTSLHCYIGPEGNLLSFQPMNCARLHLQSPILDPSEMHAIRNQLPLQYNNWKLSEIDLTFPKKDGLDGYKRHLSTICQRAQDAVTNGSRILILTDKNFSNERVTVSALFATGAVHHSLIQTKKRSKVGIIVETGEAREVHHFCVLLGYGADGIYPFLTYDIIDRLVLDQLLVTDISKEKMIANYIKASNKGILKVMAKMGISTLQSYKGAQIFEAVGISSEIIELCFKGTPSRIRGVTFNLVAADAFALHEHAFPNGPYSQVPGLEDIGQYHWRDGGEVHINDPSSIANLQDAVRNKNTAAYKTYSSKVYEKIKAATLRGLLDFNFDQTTPIDINEVEPWQNIVKRFCTGAMSYGSISMETHTTLAIAMNRLKAKSNSGEGGESPTRSVLLPNGDSMRSAIKQVASGRFGVTAYYLSDADELQIKISQGAKPAQGGELPGKKVNASIAKTRKSVAGVGLISPPPHHDIYSIEDLKQLIYDLKCANPTARISVKLVSEVGVGVIAAGVAKAKAEHILISGWDGGTGASPWSSIKNCGLPWELGLAETHQTLVLNGLRNRVVLQTDGQLKSGRDVAVACLLGAEEFGFATAPLISLGCIMMRKCHLNTCPVGIATQDPELRKKFAGQPEDVINFFYYVAEEMREIMAKLGFKTVDEMVGRSEFLRPITEQFLNPKAMTVNVSDMLVPAHTLRSSASHEQKIAQDHDLESRLENSLLEQVQPALAFNPKSVLIENVEIVNTDRTFGTTISHRVSKQFGEDGLPDSTIHIKLKGSAGQSFGAFLAPGITLELEGDSNDYVGKGLSGGKLIVYPPRDSAFKSHENVIVGNVCFYGATSGVAFISGVAGDRFLVRNSGATVVCEGIGHHGCEYMTGGIAVILGKVQRNFGSGMSGGIAYVLDEDCKFSSQCNMDMIDLVAVEHGEESDALKDLIRAHAEATKSSKAQQILYDFDAMLPEFVKVYPKDLRKVMESKQDKKKVPSIEANGLKSTTTDIEDVVSKKSSNDEKLRGFVTFARKNEPYRDPKHRIKDFNELQTRHDTIELKKQAARCMDCGISFCQADTGCPISNIIPKFNALIFEEQWKRAYEVLAKTNPFAEFTGRVCPAPCEGACTLGIIEQPVAIKSIECAIIDKAFEKGWVVPQPPSIRTEKKVAIVGSGPAGLAAADLLNKAGHHVRVFERNDRIGGLLMYGIPNMKLDKNIVQRRIELMAQEGIDFVTNADIGVNVDANDLIRDYDAVMLSTGATWPRDLNIPNRQLNGIHFAMEYLQRNTQSFLSSKLKDGEYLNASGKKVLVIGGGDTGCDCIGTAMRHGAKQVTNFELLPQPPAHRAQDNPWPQWPRVFRVDYGHAEVQAIYGKDPREYCVLSKEFVGDESGNVVGVNTIRVEWKKDDSGRWTMKEVPGTEKFYEADMIFLALGFVGCEKNILKQLNVDSDNRNNIVTASGKYQTNISKVFAAGDCRRGQSLVVWAIDEGRKAARDIDQFLSDSGKSLLPLTGGLPKREWTKKDLL